MSASSSSRLRRLDEIAHQLDLIELEMKRIGLWSADAPELRSRFASGEMKSFLDAPSFELWLQQVFIPNARDGVARDELPKESQVGLAAMRQFAYHSEVPATEKLLSLLNDFDDMIERYGRS